MKISRDIRVKLLIALGCTILYAIVFLLTYPSMGLFAAAFNVIPAAVFGLLIGVRGFFYLMLAIPINICLFSIVKSPNNDLVSHTLGITSFTLISFWVGWIRDLRRMNGHIVKQAIELEKEHKLLQEEIIRRTRAEEKLSHEALHDPLTDLPNRRLFFNRLEHAHAWSKQNPHNLSAVLYLDLDKFKTVNDGMGHKAGDELLKQVACRLKASVRSIDTVARIGGDEFAILLEAASTEEEVRNIIQRIQSCLTRPYELQGSMIVSEASIGVVMYIGGYEQLDDILRDADAAMYKAKVNCDNQFKVFESDSENKYGLQIQHLFERQIAGVE